MGLANIIELSPLFLSLPTFFISLTFTSVSGSYATTAIQSALLASLALLFIAVLRNVGLIPTETSSDTRKSPYGWIPTFLSLECVFCANNLLSPSRAMSLLIVGTLVVSIDNRSSKWTSLANDVAANSQVILVFVGSFIWDLAGCFQFETKSVAESTLGYLLLLGPLIWWSSNTNSSTVCYPSVMICNVLTLCSVLLLLQFSLTDLHLKVIAVSAGSLVVIILSQLETVSEIATDPDCDSSQESNALSGFFNKSLFMQDYKVNLVIINTVTLLIYHISLNTNTNSIGIALQRLKIQIFEVGINFALIFLIKPVSSVPALTRKPSLSTMNSVIDEDGFNGLALIAQLFNSKETRSIFNFLLLNTSFMFVQLLYSFRSKSLSLLSDSLHMFLDCLSLFLGLLASLISNRSKSSFSGRYAFGLSRIETLAGFANGSLLIGIVFGIYNESVRRIFEPVDLQKTEELLLVSILGLLVNLVGIFAFNHGHDHGSGGHSHSHSHQANQVASEPHDHSHSHSHTHTHTHTTDPVQHQEHQEHPDEPCHDEKEVNNDNMHGIFLHILADTLGSVGVVISTILIRITGLTVLDPLTSILIATLILISAIPLIKSSSSNLLLSLKGGDAQETKVRDTLFEIANITGVKSYTTPRFWPAQDDSSTLTGYLHVQFYKSESSTSIRRKVEKVTQDSKLFGKLYVQYENEMDDCWCRSGSGVFSSY